jgi:alkaline phosphatase D
MPGERSRLFEALTQRDGGGILLMSGDRHSGGIYTAKTGSAGEDMWEITSSPLNLAFGTTEENTKREPDPVRITDFIAEENFGMVEIDWAARALNLSLIGNQGEVRAQQKVSWTD